MPFLHSVTECLFDRASVPQQTEFPASCVSPLVRSNTTWTGYMTTLGCGLDTRHTTLEDWILDTCHTPGVVNYTHGGKMSPAFG